MCLNTLVRLFFPSQYAPRRMSSKSYISSPYCARILATLAEPLFLEVLAECIGLEFWGSFMGNMTIIGEITCWTCLLSQANILGELEDTIWMVIQIWAVAFGRGPAKWLISVPFASYLLTNHLPRMCGRKDRSWGAYNITSIEVKWPDTHTFAWQMPSLVCQPLGYALCYYYRHTAKDLWDDKPFFPLS